MLVALRGQPVTPSSYYLALGDSLSQGVQPDAAGASVETGQGYPDLVYATLLASHPALRLVRLGCPGRDHADDDARRNLPLLRRPQLAAATAFLRAHRGHVLLVTIDIGANDLEDCGNQPSLTQLASCIGQLPKATANVAAIMASLRAAAGPGVRIIGMNYYLPALAERRSGLRARDRPAQREVRRRVRRPAQARLRPGGDHRSQRV